MPTMTNATARRYFLYTCDNGEDGESPVCFFSQHRFVESGWGFWVNRDGDVIIDTETSNGGMPSHAAAMACRRAAVKYLAQCYRPTRDLTP